MPFRKEKITCTDYLSRAIKGGEHVEGIETSLWFDVEHRPELISQQYVEIGGRRWLMVELTGDTDSPSGPRKFDYYDYCLDDDKRLFIIVFPKLLEHPWNRKDFETSLSAFKFLD